MKKSIRLVMVLGILICSINYCFSIKPIVVPSKTIDTKVENFHALSTNDIVTLNRKQIEHKVGRKLKFKERVVLKLVQRKIKKQIKKGVKVEDIRFSMAAEEKKSHAGGFMLGLLLGLIGVLIAYLAFGKKAGKSAWIGFAISIVLVLLIFSLAGLGSV